MAIQRKLYLKIRFVLAAFLLLPALSSSAESGPDNPQNIRYRIDKQMVQLINGYAESEAARGSAAKIITRVVNEPVYGDLDGDGKADAALFLSQDLGGSGTFLYVAAAISKDGRWLGTNAVFIGDRVAPQTIRIGEGLIDVRYLDRSPEESMAVAPSIVNALELELVGGHLEVLQP